LNDSWSRGYERRAKALASLGRLDEASKAFETAISLDPNAKLEEELALVKNKTLASKSFSLPSLTCSVGLVDKINTAEDAAKLKELVLIFLTQVMKYEKDLGFQVTPQLKPVYQSEACIEVGAHFDWI
jgi:tetratricopeptide (TPR) repeat protein